MGYIGATIRVARRRPPGCAGAGTPSVGGTLRAAMRVLVVTSMYPTPAHPALGGFVRDQVDALREQPGLEVELFVIEPGGNGRWLRAARELRRRYRDTRFDVVHAHHGLTGWSARALRGTPLIVTFHGTDLSHPVVGPMSRALARAIDLNGEVVTLKEVLEDGNRALIVGRADEERVVEMSDALKGEKLRAGDTLLMEGRSGLLVENRPQEIAAARR